MRTPLYDSHVALGAKMTAFAGWEMPIQYKGIIQEHLAVRQAAGIFDVSHMGRILISGRDAEKFLDFISTNTISGKKPGTATYTVLCHDHGGSVDDAIIYRYDPSRFFIVVNAGNRSKDLAHIQQQANGFQVDIHDRYSDDGILAVQGPKAQEVISELFPQAAALKAMQFMDVEYQGETFPIARTGYTGSGGFELYAPLGVVVEIWDECLILGKGVGLEPIGLGARDTLRLEMGYALYGHELTDTIAPTESVAHWTVKMENRDFLGKAALGRLKVSGEQRSASAAVLLDKGIPREGYEVFEGGLQIGVVTSGTMSPSLGKGIALLLCDRPLAEGAKVQIQIRKNQVPAQVVKLPFLTKKDEG